MPTTAPVLKPLLDPPPAPLLLLLGGAGTAAPAVVELPPEGEYGAVPTVGIARGDGGRGEGGGGEGGGREGGGGDSRGGGGLGLQEKERKQG